MERKKAMKREKGDIYILFIGHGGKTRALIHRLCDEIGGNMKTRVVI